MTKLLSPFYLRVFLFVCLFTLPICASAQAILSDHDNQFWSEAHLSGTLIKDKVDLILLEYWRHGRDFSFATDLRTGGGIAFKINKHLTIQPNYLYLNQRPWPGVKNVSQRVFMDVTTKFSLGRFGIANRDRIERQLKRGKADETQIRERLTIDHPAHIGETQFKVFAYDEVFYSSTFKAFFRNRLAAGVSKTFNSRFTMELFYLRQNDGHGRPGDIHALSTVVKVKMW